MKPAGDWDDGGLVLKSREGNLAPGGCFRPGRVYALQIGVWSKEDDSVSG